MKYYHLHHVPDINTRQDDQEKKRKKTGGSQSGNSSSSSDAWSAPGRSGAGFSLLVATAAAAAPAAPAAVATPAATGAVPAAPAHVAAAPSGLFGGLGMGPAPTDKAAKSAGQSVPQLRVRGVSPPGMMATTTFSIGVRTERMKDACRMLSN